MIITGFARDFYYFPFAPFAFDQHDSCIRKKREKERQTETAFEIV
jgi:hypothetical protein